MGLQETQLNAVYQTLQSPDWQRLEFGQCWWGDKWRELARVGEQLQDN